MRETEARELHKSESECNPSIREIRDRAKLTKDAREMMNSMYEKREADAIRKEAEQKRLQERTEELKKEIGVDRGDER